MPKALTKTVFALFGASVLFATALRCVQLFSFTDASTGFVLKEASATVSAVYILCVIAAALCGIFFHKKFTPVDPFGKKENRRLFYVCILAGAAMFYDFVHQCVNCFSYASRTAHVELNFLLPILLTGITALFCTFYFIIMGISFVTDKYDFKQFMYFHLVPAIWFALGLLTSLMRYNDSCLAVQNNLRYAVLFFGITFSLVLIQCIDGGPTKLKMLCFTGASYAALSFILSVPSIIALIGGAKQNDVDYSFVSYLFTGVFAAAITLEALKKQKHKEV